MKLKEALQQVVEADYYMNYRLTRVGDNAWEVQDNGESIADNDRVIWTYAGGLEVNDSSIWKNTPMEELDRHSHVEYLDYWLGEALRSLPVGGSTAIGCTAVWNDDVTWNDASNCFVDADGDEDDMSAGWIYALHAREVGDNGKND